MLVEAASSGDRLRRGCEHHLFCKRAAGRWARVGLRRGRERPTPLIEVRGAMRAYSPDP